MFQSIHQLRTRSLNLVDGRDPARYLHVSNNYKTGASVNVAIAGSCNPTRACKKYCYGLDGPIARDNSIGRQLDNLRVLQFLELAEQREVDTVGLVLISDIDRLQRSWIRWHGVGDLLPGTVRLIHFMVNERPDLVHWVVTRKPIEAKKLPDHPSVRVLCSFDETTPPSTAEKMYGLRKQFRKARVRFAWVRRNEEKVPRRIDIVFHEHHGRRTLELKKPDRRTCSATLPHALHRDACDSCQRCFAP